MEFYKQIEKQLAELKQAGLYKNERTIITPQSSQISTDKVKNCINFCANNYLGLADNPVLIESAKKTMDEYGFGMASVRFICGTQSIHQQLEQKLSKFLETEDTILYSSCFDANTGLFETILSEEDAIISDELNHASIIDGIRLCKAKRFRYRNNDMKDLEAMLQAADIAGARYKLIATDGVFSMDGVIANLKEICELAEKYNALVFVDDSHAVGFVGDNGKGSIEYCQVMGKVDIISGTLGKALGGASGGYISGKKPLIDLLRQRSRPYLFSNSLAPCIVGATIAALDLIRNSNDAILKLQENTRYFREKMLEAGFNISGKVHPISPIMIGDAVVTQQFATELLAEGIYVVGFAFPVVPKEKARIRTQISTSHTKEQLDKAIAAFIKIGKKLGVIA